MQGMRMKSHKAMPKAPSHQRNPNGGRAFQGAFWQAIRPVPNPAVQNAPIPIPAPVKSIATKRAAKKTTRRASAK